MAEPPVSVAAAPGTPGPPPATPGRPPVGRVAAAYAVHAFTASGVVLAFGAAAEVCAAAPDPRVVFALLAAQVLVDAVDGPLARGLDVKRVVPRISGRTIDDLVDYLTYTFVPLLLVWRMGWVPAPAAAWVAPAMMASLFGFANAGAKDEAGGFFLGFPSYWNIVAFYLGLWHAAAGGATAALWGAGGVVAALTVLTVLPVRFVYPNLAPPPWRWPMWVGGGLWAAALAALLPSYPHGPPGLVIASLAYPAAYVALSVWLDARARAAGSRATPGT